VEKKPAIRRGRCSGPGLSVWVAAAGLLAALPAAAQSLVSSAEGRVIVKFKAEALAPAGPGRAAPFASAKAALHAVGGRMGLALGPTGALGGRMQALRVRGIASEVLAQRLARDPAVEYAVPDQRRRALAVPNDERYGPGLGGSGPAVGQWYLRAPSTAAPAAINAEAAWDITVGAADVRVAVLDTGVLFDHPDLLRAADGGKLLPGYDMITDTDTSLDGNGRDSDASDPGDAGECDGVDGASSWHGTQVSGLIGAITNTTNGFGMAGVGWDTPIVPVRVLGLCGGFDSDIVAAMRWAAGLSVAGVPPNPNPARVINLSLGSSGPCSPPYIEVMAELAQLQPSVVVVAAAGNSAGHAVSTPANCPGAIAVGGLRHVGTKVGFADLGPELALSAPAGNCVNTEGACLFPILTATNSGTGAPAAHTFSDSFNASVGTSFSTPLVAGVAALMLSQRPTLTAAELRYRLQASARPFPTSGSGAGTPFCAAPSGADQLECYCTTSTCGAGMLDAAAAVQDLPAAPEESFLGSSLPGVLARITPLTAAPAAGEPVQFTAEETQEAPGHTIASYAWEVLDGGGIVTALTGSDTVAAQAVPAANGSFTLRLTVTDDQGRSSQATHATQVGEVPAPAPVPSGGDGGGALHEAALAGLLAAALAARAAQRQRKPAPDRRV
jgi:serine protease